MLSNPSVTLPDLSPPCNLHTMGMWEPVEAQAPFSPASVPQVRLSSSCLRPLPPKPVADPPGPQQSRYLRVQSVCGIPGAHWHIFFFFFPTERIFKCHLMG